MSTLRVSNIEAKADPSSPTVNEKVKITNSNGDVMLQLDGATSGITTVGINTTTAAFTVDGAQNIQFVGVVTAASLSGNLTGNVTGNVTGQLSGIQTSITVQSTGSITVGDKFINSSGVGIGSTTAREGVNTAIGTLILNTTTNRLEVYGPEGWTNVKSLVNSGLTATGGIISDYESGGVAYRAHVFTSSGTFTVTEIGDYGSTVDYLVVAGGGGGGSINSGGGGAGGLLSSHPDVPTPLRQSSFSVATSPGAYTVTVGGGGAGFGAPGGGTPGAGGQTPGNPSVFGPGPITAYGGGKGSSDSTPHSSSPPSYGSGGGGGGNPNGATGSGTGQAGTSGQGNSGGNVSSPSGDNVFAGGGGGAGGSGSNGSPTQPGSGAGGAGLTISISGTSTAYAGGGGGSWIQLSPPRSGPGAVPQGGSGVGGNGGIGESGSGTNALFSTGSGGGGARAGTGGSGGSGIVVVRYQIGNSQLGTAKATGGSVSFYGGKTIHSFTSSGTFSNTSGSPLTVEYVAIGGGGGGGCGNGGGGGGGGAGLFLNETGITVSTTPFAVTIGAGGQASGVTQSPNISTRGNSTTIAFPSGTKTATYGGGGASTVGTGDPGGSGGGAGNAAPSGSGGSATGSSYPGTPGTTPTSGWGHAGGSSFNGAPQYGAGGGGGAGGAGGNGGPSSTGNGGAGVQLPTTFRDPRTSVGAPGPGSSGYWVAGGGGGGAGYAGGAGTGPSGIGGGPGGPYAGAGNGGYGTSTPTKSTPALANTGSGGGGTNNVTPGSIGGQGGSGLVIISYPT